ncbi:GGDEF domain-containing protein [Halorhodospira halochloris]|uniref:GGDEF domain-containing protein n=1 Tax=Halorhodospira halochloris TaxID=1052 RepID=UPI001EE8F826|nr:GGDEF domain-containing protein [Halorhodospira halochloris]MCG5531036.1 GGDEF domain-containing protein [Halorhodospira halochloris]
MSTDEQIGYQLLRLWLPLETDLQAFLSACAEAVAWLDGERMKSAQGLLQLSEQLRGSGAATGSPLSAVLIWEQDALQVHWEGQSNPSVLLKAESYRVEKEQLERLREYLSARFEVIDSETLRWQNQQMAAHYRQTKEDMEAELNDLQKALDSRQLELAKSIMAAETDSLTNALNRRAFDDYAPKAYYHAKRQRQEEISLLLIDLDFFKEINDEHGHHQGDEYLRHVVNVMESVVRSGVDRVYRIGGDEFAILFHAGAQAACSKAMKLLEQLDWAVSIGIASLDRVEGDNSFVEFYELADNALYEAKNSGRGRVAVAGCQKRSEQGCQHPCMLLQEPSD